MSRLDNIISYARDSYQMQLDNESVSYEAEMLMALIRSKGGIRASVIPTHLLTSEFNMNREAHERWRSIQVGRVMSRLGFRAKRTQEGRSGWYLDKSLLSKLLKRYSVKDENTLV